MTSLDVVAERDVIWKLLAACVAIDIAYGRARRRISRQGGSLGSCAGGARVTGEVGLGACILGNAQRSECPDVKLTNRMNRWNKMG
jgi:hypothetical protein